MNYTIRIHISINVAHKKFLHLDLDYTVMHAILEAYEMVDIMRFLILRKIDPYAKDPKTKIKDLLCF